jgi:hypothetical protein
MEVISMKYDEGEEHSKAGHAWDGVKANSLDKGKSGQLLFTTYKRRKRCR